MMTPVRTTVTIDADTEVLLRTAVRQTGQSFKEVLNQAIRRSLSPRPQGARRIKVVPLFDAPFPAEFEGRSMNRLADELDDGSTLEELGA